MLWFLGIAEAQSAAPQDHHPGEQLSRRHCGLEVSMTGKPYNSLLYLPLPGFLHVEPARITGAAGRPGGDRGGLYAPRLARRTRSHDHQGRPRHDRRLLRRAGDGRRRGHRSAGERLFREDPCRC
ncbi:MAG: hypothetical protein MZV65_02340 [Chromatiales bacterium]|nr:hypothetical protein [Chromatiales bacterium]